MSDDLEKLIDSQRWLMNNGLSNDLLKDQLFLFGSIVHKDISAVEVDVDFQKKAVKYQLYATNNLLKKINKFNKLAESNSVFGLWRFKRFLLKEGNLNLRSIVTRFVKDYLGPKWIAEVEMRSVEEYINDGAEKAENSGSKDK